MRGKPLVGLVEDNAQVRESISLLLKAYGYCVQSFATAEEFVDAGGFRAYGCLVLDFGLPGMNALDLVRKLNEGYSDVPIVVLSGTVSDIKNAELLKEGVTAVLEKPIIAPALVELISSRLKSP